MDRMPLLYLSGLLWHYFVDGLRENIYIMLRITLYGIHQSQCHVLAEAFFVLDEQD